MGASLAGRRAERLGKAESSALLGSVGRGLCTFHVKHCPLLCPNRVAQGGTSNLQ